MKLEERITVIDYDVLLYSKQGDINAIENEGFARG